MALKLIIAFITPLLLGACSLFGIRAGYEQPDYSVVETIDNDVEIRRYAPRLAAQTLVEASDVKDGRNAAFRILFDYISGANSGQTDIAMTTPVATDTSPQSIAMTAPVETAAAEDGKLAMRFYLPAEFTAETAPKPTDPRVQIVEVPETTFAVLRFSGSTDEQDIKDREIKLLSAVQSSNWRALSEPIAFFYDPPWTLPFLRRNEVAVAVTPLENDRVTSVFQ